MATRSRADALPSTILKGPVMAEALGAPRVAGRTTPLAPSPERAGRDLVERVLSRPPLAGLARLEALAAVGDPAGAEVAICLPLCDEAALIGATLDALAASIRRSGAACALVVAANDTSDDSLRIAEARLRAAGVPALILGVSLAPAIRGAPAARRIAMDIGAALAPGGALLTTDADTIAAPDWVGANLRHLAGGADLVCGAVDVDPGEIAALPGRVRECGEAEAMLHAALDARWRLLVPDGSRAFVQRAMGASLAIRAPLYAALGGLPMPASGEDRALATLCRRGGRRVVAAPDARVTASCRLRGRAAGGMAGALRERIAMDDPPCDEALVPPAVLDRRAAAWIEVSRSGMPDPHGAFEALCEARPDLRAARMGLREVRRTLRDMGHG